jgi:hypothetical protein
MSRSEALAMIGILSVSLAELPAAEPVRFLLHGGFGPTLPGEDYLRFVERVKPDVLIMGNFDQQLYAAAAPDPKSKAVALVPAEHLAKWKAIAERLHRHGIRLIGHMELFVISDRPIERTDGTGWFGYYDKLWDEKLLGPRPTKHALELLEEPDLDDPTPGSDTTARCGCRVNTKSLSGCANKPAWRAAQKALVKAAIAAGVDGFITNRNYVNHCACSHCTARFRRWLESRYTPEQLRERFGISDLVKAPLCVVGMHRSHETVPPPLVLEKQRFAKHMVKEFFDQVYVEYGRALKPDLFLSQWNHMAYFDELHLDRGHLPPSTRTSFAHGAADERWGLPLDLWGKGEDLLWYCNWGTTQNTIKEKEYAGDTVLYGKLLRALAADRPYVINKYDFYRPRNLMAEAAALGYATNAIDTPWQTEEDREVTARYFNFLRKHGELYRPAESWSEVGLAFPRIALHAGDASPLEYVEAAGRTMVRNHIQFDIVPGDLLATADLGRYRVLIIPAAEYVGAVGRAALARYVERGGKLILTPVSKEDRDRPGVAGDEAKRIVAAAAPVKFTATTVADVRTQRDAFLKAVREALGGIEHGSGCDAPWTVKMHVYRQAEAKRVVVHLVNYDHDEKGQGKSVTAREAPIAADPVAVHVRLPEGFRAKSVHFLSPDDAAEQALEFTQTGTTIEFKTRRFLVYGLCVVQG